MPKQVQYSAENAAEVGYLYNFHHEHKNYSESIAACDAVSDSCELMRNLFDDGANGDDMVYWALHVINQCEYILSMHDQETVNEMLKSVRAADKMGRRW